MADRAVQFMKQGDTIFLDNSSAVSYMCHGLMNMDITVLTNSSAGPEHAVQEQNLEAYLHWRTL